MGIRIRVRTNDPDASDEQIKAAAMQKIDAALDRLAARVATQAKENVKARAKYADRERKKTARKHDEFKVTVELVGGVPHIAPGSRTSASASRYIKTKNVDDLKPIGGGYYTYSFKRRRKGRLADSIHAEPAVNGRVVVKVDAPYAMPVEKGHVTSNGGFVGGMHFLWDAIQLVRDEFESGKFLGPGD